jgi:RNA recognition motif-containing protein
VTEEVLKQIFEATGGKVLSVSLPKDRTTGRPRGFGFVTMGTPAEAQTARDALDGSMQGGRSISVRPFQAEPPKRGEGGPMSSGPRSSAGGGPRGGPQAPDRTLYVGNLPYDCTQQEVEQLITSVAGEGQVQRVHLPVDQDGRKRGFGFVTMASSEGAKTATEQLKTADIRGRRLIVNIAHPKGERPPREGGPPSFGGGGFGGGGFGGGGGGYQNANFGPPQSRRTFDSDRRRNKHGGGGGGEGGEGSPPKRGGGGGGGRGRRNDRDDFDWRKPGGDDD